MKKSILKSLKDGLIEEEFNSGISLSEFILKYDVMFMETVKRLYSLNLTDNLSIDDFIKNELTKEYITKNKSIREISDMYNISTKTLSKMFDKYDINKSDELIIQNRKNTLIKKYGTCDLLNSKESREKAKQTNLERYGSTCPIVNKEVFNKAMMTNLRKYGVVNARQSDIVSEKIKKTNLERYGVEHAFQRQDVIKKSRNTMIERYGVKSIIEHQCLDQNFAKIISTDSKSDIRQYFIDNFKNMTFNEISEIVGLSPSRIGEIVRSYELEDILNIKSNASHLETDLLHIINGLGITNVVCNTKSILGNYELDIYLPDHKIAIEFNGNYWHSNLHKDKKYHYNKSLKCQELGIRLIHVYEYEWNNPITRNIIISLIKISCGIVDTKIYARQCEIREISNKEAKDFNNLNHIQHHRHAKITYGLFYKNELVQLMSFSKHKDYEWEIIRGCPGSNNIVIGGVSKLFKHFIKEHNPSQVFSYCDFNKFDGKSYEAIGMKFIGYTGPDLTWIINNEGISRNPNRHKELKDMSDYHIWGAGSKKYLWIKE